MAFRTTRKRLEAMCDRLNRITGHDLEQYTQHEDGTFTPNEGTYYINYEYNQPSLYQVEASGARNVLGYRGTKTEIDRMLGAYIAGISSGKGATK